MSAETVVIYTKDHRRAEVDLQFRGLYGGIIELSNVDKCPFAEVVLRVVFERKQPIDVCASGHWHRNLVPYSLTDDYAVATFREEKS